MTLITRRRPVLASAMVGVLLLGLLAVTAAAAGTFSDDDGNVHEANIEAIAAEGITRGCNPPANDLYCPTDPVTRGQMAAFLVRAMGYTDDGGGDKFIDDDGSIFETDIDRLATAGVTYGCNPPTNDRFCPNDPVLRDQMASFLARALDLEPITPSTTTTTTIPTEYPRSGDYWQFLDCETDTGTCAYSVSAHLLIKKPLLPTAFVFDPVTFRTKEVPMWRIRWFDPAGVEIPGGWSEQTFYSLDTGLISAVQVNMAVGWTTGDHRVEMCRRESQYSATCAETLLTVYFRVVP